MIREFDARTDREARSFVATRRQPSECIATFRTAETNANGTLYRTVELDLAHVETLAENQRSGADDAIEIYAATFALPGEILIGVN